MTQVYVSIGSNINPLQHIQASLHALQQHYGALHTSNTYESVAVGFDGAHFYNLVVRFDTTANPQIVVATLRQIEAANGRQRSTNKFSSRTLDLDLLLYGDWVNNDTQPVIPHPDIKKYAFVLQPLAEIAPNTCYPQSEQTYATLWADYTGDKHNQWQVDIKWEI